MTRLPLNQGPSPDDGARNTVASMEDGPLRHSIEDLALKTRLNLFDIKITDNGVPVLLNPVRIFYEFRGVTVYISSLSLKRWSGSEVIAVVARKIAYYRRQSFIRTLLSGFLLVFLVWVILLQLQSVFRNLGPDGELLPPVLQALVARYVMRPVSTAVRMACNAQETKEIYASDAFVAERGYAKDLRSALTRVHKTTPEIERDWLYGIDNYSWPTLSERIRRLELLMPYSGTPAKDD